MGKLVETSQSVLPEFQTFLFERRLVPEKNAPFHARWVSRYLRFAQSKGVSVEEYSETEALEFLNGLRSDDRIQDWQVRQATDALQLYYFHFLGNASHQGAVSTAPDDVPGILNELRRMIRLRHYAYSTEHAYLRWAERFLRYAGKNGAKQLSGLSVEDYRDYLSHLALKEKVSASTQNQAFNAILFLFRNVLRISPDGLENTIRAKRGFRMPVVLSFDEVARLFAHMEGLNKLIAELLYGSGMRLMEVFRLRVKDVDFGSNTIFARSGKGDKDRSTVLPLAVKDRLREHLKDVKALHDKDLAAGQGAVHMPDALDRKYPNAAKEWAWQYVFPSSKLSVDPRSGKVGRHHMSDTTIQEAVKRALRKAGIAKHASVHTLRHSFATHLIQSGVNIREVQSLLGHKNVETTMVYTHVLRNMACAPKSPLDALYEKA